MSKQIIYNTWQGAFFNMGGGEVQLLNSKLSLEKLGYKISLFDMWKPQTDDVRLLHQFSIENGVEHVIDGYRRLNVPVALSTILWSYPERDESLFRRIRSLFQKADVLLTNSDAESERLAGCFNIDRQKFIKTRNGITDEYLNRESNRDFRAEYDINSEFILSVANIDRRKNTHGLIEACNSLGLTVILIGHIRDSVYFESFKDKYNNYIYLGPISDVPLLKSAYQQCLIFALPSVCETPGIAALEAASQGAKIVITNEGSTAEYFQDMVTYVCPDDVDDIANGITHEIDQDRNEALMDHVVTNYTWDEAALDLQRAYDYLSI